MNRFFVFAALALAAASCAQPAPRSDSGVQPARAEIIARGEYLVLHVAGCNDCHTPMTPQGPDMSQALVGAALSFAPLRDQPWAAYAPPLAGLPEGYDEAKLAHFLQTGERAIVQTPVLPPMPAYRLNAEDAGAVAAYIASLEKPGMDPEMPPNP